MAVILPTEADTGPHSLNLPPLDEADSIDRLNIINDGSTSDDIGLLTGNTFTGFGSAGITYHDVEILDVLLGTGNDTFIIHSTLTPDGVQGGITIIHGGAGSDTIAVQPAPARARPSAWPPHWSSTVTPRRTAVSTTTSPAPRRCTLASSP